MVAGVPLPNGVTAKDVHTAHAMIKQKLFDKYNGLHQAFRQMDKDGSGYITREELEGILGTLNLGGIKPVVVGVLVEMMDVENDVEDDADAGPTDIGFREFARVMAADDVSSIKALAPRKVVKKVVDPSAEAKLRPGVRAADVRAAQQRIKEKLLTKFSTFGKAFKFIDKDRTGNITREELELAMYELQLTSGIASDVVSTLIDLIDSDEDEGDEIEFSEFARVLSSDDVMAMAAHKKKMR